MYDQKTGVNLLDQNLTLLQQQQREYEERLNQLLDENLRLQHQSIHDQETTLYSRAYFHTRLAEEMVRSERYRHFLSLILVHVELVNNQSTQDVNREIKRIGMELMMGLTRRSDIIATYRRRQMVIMLPETDPRGAHILLQRYQAMFPNSGRRLTYAVLTYPNDATNTELVLNRLQELSEDLFRGNFRPHPLG